MNYQEAVKYIQDDNGQIVLGLYKIEKLLELLGNPEKNLSFVHVAGTNGKGSVCAMTSNILTKAGYKTGLFTSPVILNFAEQFKIDGIDISEEEFIKCAGLVKEKADLMDEQPSSFEKAVALAFLFFDRSKCDLVVIEVGMGGDEDATNTIPAPLVSCIVNIDFDHMGFLGNSIEEIASKKAGIIKSGSIVVAADQGRNALGVIEATARKNGCIYRRTDRKQIIITNRSAKMQTISYKNYKDLELALLGEHQSHNLAIVIEVVEALRACGYRISDDEIREGLRSVYWQGRFEIASDSPLFIIDGAHNPHGIKALKESLMNYFPGEKFVFVVGILRDKDYVKMISQMLPLASTFVTISPDNPRAMSAADCAKEVIKAGYEGPVLVSADTKDAIKIACEQLKQNEGTRGICAFGSLYSIEQIKNGL